MTSDLTLDVPESPAQRRARRLKRLVRNALLLVLTYFAVVGLARLSHRYVLYQAPDDAAASSLPDGATLLTVQAADGAAVHALEFAGSSPRTVVHFHGNAETADQNAALAHLLVKKGLSVVLVEYRGYGRSKGASSNEAGLYFDAEAVLAELARRGTRPDDIVLWGQSLGGGVATEMAARGRGARVILVAPFTSTVDLAQSSVPFLPGSLVMGDRYDNAAKAPAITMPVLVVHGDSDTVIPLAQGKRLAASFPHATFREVPMGTHTNLYKNTTTFGVLADFAKAP